MCCVLCAVLLQVVPHVGDPKTWASRVLVLGYAFLVLIMVHLFTGEGGGVRGGGRRGK